MNNKYRVAWQAGMRLTDETFRASDEYYLSCLQPLYAVLVNGDYGFLSLPIFRYELTESALSVIELEANAICYSGKLIRLSYSREERTLFQNINLPDTTEPLILYVDATSEKMVMVSQKEKNVPLCDVDYQILIRPESEHYNNPDAVPLARFTYKHGWSTDPTFIAPCISLRANGMLLRSASNYVVELEGLIKALQASKDTAQILLVMSSIPILTRIAMEVKKESDKMSPRHLITLMQEGIQTLLALSEMEKDVTIPERERWVSFVESHYTPYIISEMVNEGIYLTHALTNIIGTFAVRETKSPKSEVEKVRLPRRVIGSTDSLRKKHS